MRILYDDHAFRQRFGGVPKYFTEIISRLPSDWKWRIVAMAADNEFVRDGIFKIPAWPFPWLRKMRFFGRRYEMLMRRLNDWLFSRSANSKSVDLIHLTEPHYYGEYWKCIPREKKVVVTIVDLIPEIVMKREDVKSERIKILARADKIIAISEYTKARIKELYDVPDEKISMIPLGYTKCVASDSTPVFHHLKYILYVGGRYEYKNFPWMVRALVPVLKSDADLMLVCTGVPFSQEEKAFLRELCIADQVIQKPIPDRQMQSLYAHAQCFIYPSKMEGFGIPILDAFAAKCPVILSNCSCFPEVGGDAALYFEDGDEDGLRRQVQVLMSDASLRQKMIDRGLARLSQFSWDRCADETISVYREATGK